MKATNPLLAILALTGIAVIPGCGTGEASVTDAAEVRAATPVPVETSAPFRGDIYATYHATATIESDVDAPVLARVGGEVVELLVEEGDAVKAGQVLARLDGERLRLEMLSARADLERVSGELERYDDLAARGLVSEAMYDGLKFDVDAMQARYDLARLNYEYSAIRATISGVVSGREIKLGQHIPADSVVFRITDTSELVAYLQIPQSELTKFAAGHGAELAVASMPGATFDATIARISPTIDTRNGTFRATAVIRNDSGDLVPGMFARFMIAYEKHTDALLVPSIAIIEEDDEASVYVVSEGAVMRRIVETGIANNGQVEILDGLEDNEEIVVVGHSGLRDGSKVLASNKTIDSFTG